MQNGPPKIERKLPSWVRPVAWIVVETFLWTTLSFDIALAFDHTENHLRPKSVAEDGGIKTELQRALTGTSEPKPAPLTATAPTTTSADVNVSVAQDGGGKPFRGKFPSLSFLSKQLSGSEFDVMRMAVSPSKGLEGMLAPSESEIAAFFTYVQAIGFDELIQIQNVTKRIESLTVNATRKGLLLTSVSSLREKITPLLGHVGTPIGIGLPDILASGTEDLDGILRTNFSNAFAKAVGARGSPQAKLTLIKSYVAPLPHASKLRLLHLLRLIGELKNPEEKQRAIVSFVGRYGFSIENAIQLSKIFNGKANLMIGIKDLLQSVFYSSVGMKAPDEVVEILVDALENSQISLTSVSFEIGHWATALSGKRTELSDEEKSELVALLSKHPHWFKQFAEDAVNRGTVERIMLGKEPDIENIPEEAKTLLYDLRNKDLATMVQIYWVAQLIEHYGVTPADLKAIGIDGKMRDLGALVIAKGISTVKSSLFGKGSEAQEAKMEFFENNFRDVARRVHVREKLTDPRATLLLFGALYPRSTSNVHLALSALTSHYPDLFYRQTGGHSQLIHPEVSDNLIQKSVEDLRGKPLRRDEVEGLVDGIFQDVRFRRFSREYTADLKVMKPLKDKVERLVTLLRESSFEEGKIEEAANAVFETGWLRNLSLQSFERFKVKNGKQLTDNAAADLTNKLFIDLRKRVITDLRRKVFYDLYKEIRDVPIRELKADTIAEVVLDSMDSRLQESGVEQAITSELIDPISDNVTRYLSQRPLREDQIALLRRVLQFALEIETKRQADLTSRDGGAKALDTLDRHQLPETIFENFVDVQKLPNGYERRVIDLTQMAGLKEKISALENLFDLKMQSGDEYALLVKDGKVFAIALENREQGLFRPVSLPESEGPAYTKEEMGALAQGYQQAIARAEVLETEQMERPTTDFGWARHFAYKYHLKAAFSLALIATAFVIPGVASAFTHPAPAAVPQTPDMPESHLGYASLETPQADLAVDLTETHSQPTIAGRYYSELPILSYGDHGERIREAQAMLNTAVPSAELDSLLKGTRVDVASLKSGWQIDGHYGWRTEALVYAFQKKYDLTADGDIGPETWKKLQEVTKSTPKMKMPPEGQEEVLLAQAGMSDVEPGPLAAAAAVPPVAHAPSSPATPSKVVTAATPDTVKAGASPPLPVGIPPAPDTLSQKDIYRVQVMTGQREFPVSDRAFPSRFGSHPDRPPTAWQQLQQDFRNIGMWWGGLGSDSVASVGGWSAHLLSRPRHTEDLGIVLSRFSQIPSSHYAQFFAALKKAESDRVLLDADEFLNNYISLEKLLAFRNLANRSGISVHPLYRLTLRNHSDREVAVNTIYEIIRSGAFQNRDSTSTRQTPYLLAVRLDPTGAPEWKDPARRPELAHSYETTIQAMHQLVEREANGRLLVLVPAILRDAGYRGPGQIEQVILSRGNDSSAIVKQARARTGEGPYGVEVSLGHPGFSGHLERMPDEVTRAVETLHSDPRFTGRVLFETDNYVALRRFLQRADDPTLLQRIGDVLKATPSAIGKGIWWIKLKISGPDRAKRYTLRSPIPYFLSRENAGEFLIGTRQAYWEGIWGVKTLEAMAKSVTGRPTPNALTTGPEPGWLFRIFNLFKQFFFTNEAEFTEGTHHEGNQVDVVKMVERDGKKFEEPVGPSLKLSPESDEAIVAVSDTTQSVRFRMDIRNPNPKTSDWHRLTGYLRATRYTKSDGEDLGIFENSVPPTFAGRVARRIQWLFGLPSGLFIKAGETQESSIVVPLAKEDDYSITVAFVNQFDAPAAQVGMHGVDFGTIAQIVQEGVKRFVPPPTEAISSLGTRYGGRLPIAVTMDMTEGLKDPKLTTFLKAHGVTHLLVRVEDIENVKEHLEGIRNLIKSSETAGFSLLIDTPLQGEGLRKLLLWMDQEKLSVYGYTTDVQAGSEEEKELKNLVESEFDSRLVPVVARAAVTEGEKALSQAAEDYIQSKRQGILLLKAQSPSELMDALKQSQPTSREDLIARITSSPTEAFARELEGVVRKPWRTLTATERYLQSIAGLIEGPTFRVGKSAVSLSSPSEGPSYFVEQGKEFILPLRIEDRGTRYINEYDLFVKLIHIGTGEVTTTSFPLRPMARSEKRTIGVALGGLQEGRYKYQAYAVPKNYVSKPGDPGIPKEAKVYGTLQVGKPSLAAGPVSTDSYPMGQSLAHTTIRTTLRNSGDAPITVYPVGVFQDKRTGKVLATDDRTDDALEAYFVDGTGNRTPVKSLKRGESVSVQVKLTLPPDPLDAVKGKFVGIRREARTLDVTQSPDTLRQTVVGLFDQAEAIGREALGMRERDAALHGATRKELVNKKESTTDIDQALSGLREGIAKLRAALTRLQEARTTLSKTEDPREIEQIASEAIGGVARGLREVSDGIYGAKVIFVDVGKERKGTRAPVLGDNGILARTEPVLYEVQTPSAIAWKFEDLASQIEALETADANLLKLENDLNRQKEGLVLDSAYLDRALQTGPVTTAAQFGNQILGALSKTQTMKDVEDAIASKTQEALEAKLKLLNGDKPPKEHHWVIKVGNVVVKPFIVPFKSIGSILSKDKRPEIRQALLEEMSKPGAMDSLSQDAKRSAKKLLVSQGRMLEARLLDLMMDRDSLSVLNTKIEKIYKGVTETDSLVAANQKAAALLGEAGGVEVVSAKTRQLVTTYLELKGLPAPQISVIDLTTLRDALFQVRDSLPETFSGELLTVVDNEMLERERRKGTVQRILASIGRLESKKLPEARAHRDRIAGELALLQQALTGTAPLSAEEFQARYAKLIQEKENALEAKRKQVQALETTLTGLQAEKASLQAGEETPTAASVLARGEEELGKIQVETAATIIRFTEKGKRAFDEKRYEAAKDSLVRAIALEPFHHTSAYLEGLISETTTPEEVKKKLEERREIALKAEESLAEAKKYWLKTDEKLKELGQPVGEIAATDTTIAQVDRFFVVAIHSLETVYKERMAKSPKKDKLTLQIEQLIGDLATLRYEELPAIEGGKDLSPLLLKAEAKLDEAYRALNKFSLRITGLNLALSLFRAKIGGLGFIPIFNVAIPDPKAPLKAQFKELTLGADGVRMAAESTPYGRSLEAEAEELVNQLLADFSGRRETAQKAFDLERKIDSTKRALAEKKAELKAGESMLSSLKSTPLQPSFKTPQVVTAKERVLKNVIAAKKERNLAKEALEILLGDKQYANSAFAINAAKIDTLVAQQKLDSAVVDSLVEDMDKNAKSLFNGLNAQFEAYEARARAEKGYKGTGRWHVSTPLRLLTHPKELAANMLGLGAVLFIGSEEIAGGHGAKQTILSFVPYAEHPLTAFATGLVTVSSPDQELTIGASPTSLPRYLEEKDQFEQGLRKEKPTYPMGVGMSFKLGGLDKRFLAKQYLTSKEAAYIIASVISKEYAGGLLKGIEHISDRVTGLLEGDKDISRRKEEKKVLTAFIERLEADSTDLAKDVVTTEKVAARTEAALDSLDTLLARQEEAEKGTGAFQVVKVEVPPQPPAPQNVFHDIHKKKMSPWDRVWMWGFFGFLAAFLFKRLVLNSRRYAKELKEMQKEDEALVRRERGEIEPSPSGTSAADGGHRRFKLSDLKVIFIGNGTPWWRIRRAKNDRRFQYIRQSEERIGEGLQVPDRSFFEALSPVKETPIPETLGRKIYNIPGIHLIGLALKIVKNLPGAFLFLWNGLKFYFKEYVKADYPKDPEKETTDRRFSSVEEKAIESAYAKASAQGVSLDDLTPKEAEKAMAFEVLQHHHENLDQMILFDQDADSYGSLINQESEKLRQDPNAQATLPPILIFATKRGWKDWKEIIFKLDPIYFKAVKNAKARGTLRFFTWLALFPFRLLSVPLMFFNQTGSQYGPSMAARGLRAQGEGANIRVSRESGVASNPELKFWAFLNHVEGRWGGGDVGVKRDAYVGGQPQLWAVDELLKQRKLEWKEGEEKLFHKRIRKLLDSSEPRERTLGYYLAIHAITGFNFFTGSGETDTFEMIHPSAMQEDDVRTMGPDALGRIDEKVIIARNLFPKWIVIIPHGLRIKRDKAGNAVKDIHGRYQWEPKRFGQRFEFDYRHTGPKNTALGAFGQVLSGIVWFDTKIENGKVTGVRHDVRKFVPLMNEAERVAKEKASQADREGRLLLDELITQEHHGSVVLRDVQGRPVFTHDSGLPVGLEPHQGFRGNAAKLMNLLFSLRPITFFAPLQDEHLMVGAKARYHPGETEAYIQGEIKKEKKTLEALPEGGADRSAIVAALSKIKEGLAKDGGDKITNLSRIPDDLLKRKLDEVIGLMAASGVTFTEIPDRLIESEIRDLRGERLGYGTPTTDEGRIIEQGAALLNVKELLETLSEMSADEKVKGTLAHLASSLGFREKEYSIGAIQVRESALYRFARLADYEGLRRGVGIPVVGETYHGSNHPHVFKSGDYKTHTWLGKKPEYKKLMINAEDTDPSDSIPFFARLLDRLNIRRGWVRTRSWLWGSHRGSVTGGIPVHEVRDTKSGNLLYPVRPLELYLGDSEGMRAKKTLHEFYIAKSELEPNLDEMTEYLALISQEFDKRNVALGQNRARHTELVSATNEKIEARRKEEGMDQRTWADVTEKQYRDLAKLEQSGYVHIVSRPFRMLRYLSETVATLTSKVFVLPAVAVGLLFRMPVFGPIVKILSTPLVFLGSLLLGGLVSVVGGGWLYHLAYRFDWTRRNWILSKDAKIRARLHGIPEERIEEAISGFWDNAEYPLLFGASVNPAVPKWRIRLFNRRGTMLDAPPIPSIMFEMVLNEFARSQPYSGHNVLDHDGLDVWRALGEDTGFGMARNAGRRPVSPFGIPVTPAIAFHKVIWWISNFVARLFGASVFRTAGLLKGRGIQRAIQRLGEHPAYKEMENIEKVQRLLSLLPFMKAFEHDQVRFRGGQVGFLDYVYFAHTGHRKGLQLGQVGPFQLGAAKASRDARFWETVNELSGGRFREVEVTLQGETHDQFDPYEIAARMFANYTERTTQPPVAAKDGGWKEENARQYVRGWEAVSPEVKQQLLYELNEVLHIDVNEWRGRLNVIQETPGKRAPPSDGYEFPEAVQITSPLLSRGKSEIHKMALLLPAGGAGSRLIKALKANTPEGDALRAEYNIRSIAEVDQFTKPTWKITKVMQKSALQLTLEAVAHLDPEMPVVIGLGPYTADQIRHFLKENNYFGLRHVGLVEDDLQPVVDKERKIVLTEDNHVVTGGMGGAGSLKALGKPIELQGTRQTVTAFEWIRSFGRDKLFIFNADNPGLPEEIIQGVAGTMSAPGTDVVALGYDYPIGKPYGVFTTERHGDQSRIVIVEAFERGPVLDAAMQNAVTRGVPLYANAGAYALSLDAAEELARNFSDFPWHTPDRELDVLDTATGNPLRGYRFEKFNPDILEVLARRWGKANVQILRVKQRDILAFKKPEDVGVVVGNVEARDQERLRTLAPDIQIAESAVVEVSPKFEGKIGKGVKIAEGAEIYFGEGDITIDDGVVLSGKIILEGPAHLQAKDGATKTISVVTPQNEITPEVILAAPTVEETIAIPISVQTGIDTRLFIEEIRLLDSKTRNIIGKISEKIIFPEVLRAAVQKDGITAGEILKLYQLLSRHFGEETFEKAKEVRLPEFDVRKLQDPLIDLDIIRDPKTPPDIMEGIMGLIFTPDQLNDLKHQLLESNVLERQV